MARYWQDCLLFISQSNIKMKNANHLIPHVEKIVSLLSLGICQAIKHKVLSVDEAERLLYTPATMEILNRIGANKRVSNLIHQGCELEDFLKLVPDAFTEALSKLEQDSLDSLQNTKNIDWQKHCLLYQWLKTYIISLAVLEEWETPLSLPSADEEL